MRASIKAQQNDQDFVNPPNRNSALNTLWNIIFKPNTESIAISQQAASQNKQEIVSFKTKKSTAKIPKHTINSNIKGVRNPKQNKAYHILNLIKKPFKLRIRGFGGNSDSARESSVFSHRSDMQQMVPISPNKQFCAF